MQGNDFSSGKWDFPPEKSQRSRRTRRRDRLNDRRRKIRKYQEKSAKEFILPCTEGKNMIS